MASLDSISPYLDWWALAAWLGINILVPVLLPLLVLWLFSIPNVTATLAARSIIKSIGKGELFWAAMGMAASTCYELFALQKLVTNPNRYGITWLVFWLHLGVILGSAIMVGAGSLNNRRPAAGNPHIPDRKVFVSSIGVLIFTVLSYSTTHAVLSALEEAIKVEAKSAAVQEKEDKMKRLADCLGGNGNSVDGMKCLEVIK
ncbi:hypothetical protein IP92_00450 [Pseudoduganella flava]|uniref:DUF4282 domain-containing protein n=1 Tax=Pseudoduganella flava TaxID=871742 RepID=A0A562Q3Y4_9BURK|nr:hypothetical protein [Pseudoduganella flava]QGZ41500.1 hypothetical protein GO485_22190 [Pseudoduganella flava]TWI51465.1 hypothetical protein IP92_00450 [Pseudoduganella flava]